jgi:subtilisin family serine protease
VQGVSSAALTLPNDPLLLNQYWHYNLVDAFRVWPTNSGSSSVLVAVVDQGVRFDHPSMAANFTADGYNFVTAGNRLLAAASICTSSGGGTTLLTEAGVGPDPTLPDDFLGITSTGCWVRNTAGDHGLHVSGTIGAPGNDGIGAAGLNWSVRIRPVRVLDITGSGSFFDIAQGVLYAAGLPAAGAGGATVSTSPGARVINMSLGGSGDLPVVRNAIAAAAAAGSLVVASAGNGATSTPSYPAAYPQVLSVAALGPDLQLSSYTNVGSNVSLAAPGGDFRNCCGGGGGVLSTTWNYITQSPNYAFYTGTSMAAPHVTGVAALVLAVNPTMTSAQLRQRLQSTAVDVGAPGRDDRYGYGIVNAYNAVNNVTSAQRATFVRIVDAGTGDTVRTVAVGTDGSYTAARLPAGSYYVVAGEDDSGDKKIGVPGRRFGWFGGAAASPIALTAGQTAAAAVVVGTPTAAKPNGTFSAATRLFVNSYLIDQVTATDPFAFYVVQIPKAGSYVLETTGVLGTCGIGMELDTVLELYDSTQALKARNDNTTFAGSVFCSQLSTSLTAGTYYLRVLQSAASGTSGGQFRIAVRDTP